MIPSLCAAVRRVFILPFRQASWWCPSGFSLLEVMLTMGLIALLMALTIPCWNAISRSQSRHASTTLVMESLEQARLAALTSKNDVWVIFRSERSSGPNSLRLLSKQGSAITPLAPWQKLPPGIAFREEEDSLMKEKPPGYILSAALNGQSPNNQDHYGSLMFLQSGRVGVPIAGGNTLQLALVSTPAKGLFSTILLSRATGRATCQ